MKHLRNIGRVVLLLVATAALLAASAVSAAAAAAGPGNGSTVEFLVTAVQTYLKAQFPTEAVYGPTPDAELRLITCGGAFDPATSHYLSNIVVYATERS
jgi:hypothetical protein